MKKQLSISDYESAESSARALLPNAIIQTFEPALYTRRAYPTTIKLDQELARYLDQPCEDSGQRTFERLLGRFTIEEFDLFQKLLGCIADFSEEWFGKVAIAKNSPCRAFSIRRHLRYMYGLDLKPRVFEVQPGAGYLGALLHFDGMLYAGTDSVQAHYLLQNHLWNFCSGGKVTELARTPMSAAHWANFNTSDPSNIPIFHIPWWEFRRFGEERMVECDSIVCGSLADLSVPQVRFIAATSRQLLLGMQTSRPSVIINDYGTNDSRIILNILKIFYEYGFSVAFKDNLITVLTIAESPIGKGTCPLSELTNGNMEVTTPHNVLGQLIINGREDEKESRVIPYEQLDTLFTLILESSDHLNSEERFLRYLNLHPSEI